MDQTDQEDRSGYIETPNDEEARTYFMIAAILVNRVGGRVMITDEELEELPDNGYLKVTRMEKEAATRVEIETE